MRISLVILALMLFSNVYARVGMGETHFETPNGHVICDCDPYDSTPVLIGYEDTIKLLDRWYFYHDHIVGEGKDYFFIFNELTNDLNYFRDEKDWRIAIEQKDLMPFYTRWCDISDAPESFIAMLMLSSFITVPLFLILVFLVVGFSYVNVIVWNRRTWTFTLCLLTIIILLLAYTLNIHSV